MSQFFGDLFSIQIFFFFLMFLSHKCVTVYSVGNMQYPYNYEWHECTMCNNISIFTICVPFVPKRGSLTGIAFHIFLFLLLFSSLHSISLKTNARCPMPIYNYTILLTISFEINIKHEIFQASVQCALVWFGSFLYFSFFLSSVPNWFALCSNDFCHLSSLPVKNFGRKYQRISI